MGRKKTIDTTPTKRTIDIDPAVVEKLNILGAVQGMSQKQLLARIIELYIQKNESVIKSALKLRDQVV